MTTGLFRFIKWVFNVASTPLALLLVWIIDIRPFTKICQSLTFLNPSSGIVEKINSLNPSIIGAIDVACLLLIFNILGQLFNKLQKPVKIEVEITDFKSKSNVAYIEYKEDLIGTTDPHLIKCKISCEVHPNFFSFFSKVFRDIKIRFNWHPDWLSVTHDFKDALECDLSAGSLSFNIMQILSKSDPKTTLEGKLLVLVNNGLKRDGNIACEIEINNERNLFIYWISKMTIYIIVKTNISPCKIKLI